MKRMPLLNAVLGMGTLGFLVASIWAYVQPPPPLPPKETEPHIKIVPDQRTAPDVSLEKPFRLQFGRGSGYHGLGTIQMDETGMVHLCRQRYDLTPPVDYSRLEIKWMKVDLQLSPEAVRRVLNSLQERHVLKLAREYHTDIYDGTQWVFWMEQAGWQKNIYCDNYFPEEIRNFAKDLERELEKAGLEEGPWKKADQDDKWLWGKLEKAR